MSSVNNHNHSACSCVYSSTSVQQTLNEMEWERGIWNAALSDDLDKVKSIIAKSQDHTSAVRALDNSGYTALHYAARSGNLDVCRLLLDEGALVDAPTRSGAATPLHRAAITGQIKIVQLLLKHNACPTKQDADGQTVLHKAAERKHQDLVKYLLETFPELQHIKDHKGRLAMDLLTLTS